VKRHSLWALVLVSLPLPAMAQSYSCVPPARIAVQPAPRPDGPARRTAIAGYTLAVSWSPEFCRSGRDPASLQCSGRGGQFGFILHGLWPESRSGPAPQWCATSPRPTPEQLRGSLCMTPAPHLLEHEWARHGSCMARTPAAYFATEARLWAGLRWPDANRLSRQEGLTAGDLRRAIARTNPAWRPEQIGLLMARGGWLRELRLCYSRTLTPIACPRGLIGPADTAPLKIWL
jgi:ribonuclease T2